MNFIIAIFLIFFWIGFGYFLLEALSIIAGKIIALLKEWAEPKDKNAKSIIAKGKGADNEPQV